MTKCCTIGTVLPWTSSDRVATVSAMSKPVRVVFDESHSEAWTIRPEVADAMQPSHPADSSYARAADALAARDFVVAAHTEGPLSTEALAGADMVVIAPPSDPKWERTVPSGPPRLSDVELDAVEAFVRGGGGLVLLGEEEQDKYGNNLVELASRFGITIHSALVSDYERHHHAPHWVLADVPQTGLTARVSDACFSRATTLAGDGDVVARASATSSAPGAPLAIAARHGAGRVIVLGDSDLFGDDCLDDFGHRDLWLNLVYWAAQGAFAQAEPARAQTPPAWAALKEHADALRLLQAPDGSVADGDARGAAAPAEA